VSANRSCAPQTKPPPTADAPGPATTPAPPSESKSPLTLIQANLLVAMLGGFWARQADGHPGPDLLGRGLVILNGLVEWERMKSSAFEKLRPPKKPGASRVHSACPPPTIRR